MWKKLGKNDLKEEYRIFFMVKGHLNASPQTVMECYNGYFNRLWRDGSDGGPLYEYDEQFEHAWEKKVW